MSDEIIFCNVCMGMKPKSIYMKIFSGEWEGTICNFCIKNGTILHADDGDIIIDFRKRLQVPGFEELS
jgi:hypothetical protein